MVPPDNFSTRLVFRRTAYGVCLLLAEDAPAGVVGFVTHAAVAGDRLYGLAHAFPVPGVKKVSPITARVSRPRFCDFPTIGTQRRG